MGRLGEEMRGAGEENIEEARSTRGVKRKGEEKRGEERGGEEARGENRAGGGEEWRKP